MQTRTPASQHGRRSATRDRTARRPVARLSILGRAAVGLTALSLVAGLSISPIENAQAAQAQAQMQVAPAQTYQRVSGQAYTVDADVAAPAVTRDELAATDGAQTLASNGTNEDWAKLVLMDGGWPQSDANVTVMLRWMRQENGPTNWWNRNNPLNNGYGSGGGAGLGSYPDLQTAAKYAAGNLQRGYPEIVAGLASSSSPDVTAAAIWASPWSTSHYANGADWSTSPAEIVTAPSSDW